MPDLLLALGYTALLLLVIRRSRFHRPAGIPAWWIGGAFLLKVMAGTALWALYTFVYTDRATADIYKYFDDSAVMFGALEQSPGDYLRMLTGIGNDSPHFDEQYYRVMNNWYRKYESNMYNDAHTVIRFNALLRLISFGSIHVHTVFAAFLSFTGSLGLVRAVMALRPELVRATFVATLLLPSVLFWSSGVIKESLLMAALGLLVWVVLGTLAGRLRKVMVLWALPLVVLLFFLKFYVLLSMVPGLVAYALCHRRPRTALAVFLGVHLLFMLAAANSERLIPGFDMLSTLMWKQRDFIGLALTMNSGSFIAPTPLEPTFTSFLAQAPHALYTTFLGPLQTWSNGAMGLAGAAENVVVLGLLGWLLLGVRSRSGDGRAFVLYALSFCLLLGLVIGWTTPVMGAVVRYRVPLLPFLFYAALMATDTGRLFRRCPWLRPLPA